MRKIRLIPQIEKITYKPTIDATIRFRQAIRIIAEASIKNTLLQNKTYLVEDSKNND